jgi:hypothetical protein
MMLTFHAGGSRGLCTGGMVVFTELLGEHEPWGLRKARGMVTIRSPEGPESRTATSVIMHRSLCDRSPNIHNSRAIRLFDIVRMRRHDASSRVPLARCSFHPTPLWDPFMRTRLTCLTTLSLAAAALVVTSMTGCKSDPNDVSFNSVKGDLTPELFSVAESPEDVDRDVAMNFNQNLRMFWDDMGYVWMTDRASSLSSYPIIDTAGNP